MVIEKTKAVKIFYSYSHKDKGLRDELAKFLGRSYITGWTDREILPGSEWADQIDTELNSADIILLFISADFVASEYAYGREMKRALERHEAGEAVVLPIILRPVFWKDTPFSKLRFLPADGKPITTWINLDEAFFDVTQGIRRAISELLKRKYVADIDTFLKGEKYAEALFSCEQALWHSQDPRDDPALYFQRGDILVTLRRLEEAITDYDRAIQLDSANSELFRRKGDVLFKLVKLEDALNAYNQAIQLESTNPHLYKSRGDVLAQFERPNEAIADYDLAIRLEPDGSSFYKAKGNIQFNLGHIEEALKTYDQAIQLEPANPDTYQEMGDIFYKLGRLENAIDVYERAIVLDPQNAFFWRRKGAVLFALHRIAEALEAYEHAIQLEPTNPPLYKEKGDILFELGRLEEALVDYEDAIRLRPTFASAYHRQAQTLDRIAQQSYQRLKERAEQAYKRAEELEGRY